MDRPGLCISQREQFGEDLQLFITAPGYPWLSLKFDPSEGISLCANVERRGEGGGPATRVHAIAQLERSWSSQPAVVQEQWSVCFEQVEHVLSCVHDALQNNTPLGATSDWSTSLREYLERSVEVGDGVDRWMHWVNTWGTGEMMQAFRLVDSLLDFEQEPGAWREQLLHAWKSLLVSPSPALLMEDVDSSVFDNT